VASRFITFLEAGFAIGPLIYCSRGTNKEVADQARKGVKMGFEVFCLKVGLDIEAELGMVCALRETVSPKAKIRLDTNGAWTVMRHSEISRGWMNTT